MGHLGRLNKLLSKIEQGGNFTMVGLGNSVTADYGGIVGSMQDRYRLGYMGNPSRCRGACLQLGWMLPVFQHLMHVRNDNNIGNEQQRPQDSPSAVVNVGQAARYLSNYLDCYASAVPAEADLIIVDGVNGLHPITGNQFKPTERLLRRLLTLPNQPAVVVLHWIDWCACGTELISVSIGGVDDTLHGADDMNGVAS